MFDPSPDRFRRLSIGGKHDSGVIFASSHGGRLVPGLTGPIKSGQIREEQGSLHLIRIALCKMLVLLKLVIVASLAAYSLPTVSFAMHGDASASYSVTMPDSAAGANHADAATDHHDHGKLQQSADHDRHGKTVKQDCCSDFCLNVAIVADTYSFASTAPSVLRFYSNDGLVFGELSSLQRPPSIRA